MTDELDPNELQQLLDATAALPRSVEPEGDAWPAIRDRIEALRVRPISPDLGAQQATRSTQRWSRPSWLAAAAVILVVLSSAVTLLMVRFLPDQEIASIEPFAPRRVPPAAEEPPARLGTPGTAGARGTAVIAASTSSASDGVFARYNAASDELVTALEARRSRLDPHTVAVLDSCLSRIDAAIAEARSALKDDPRNSVFTELLSATYRQKLDLLKRAGDLPLRAI